MNTLTRSSILFLVTFTLIAALSATPSVAADGTHTVRTGDTLSEIAGRYGVSVEAIRSANNLSNADQIRVGMVLVIPGLAYVSSQTTDLNAATGFWYGVRTSSGYAASLGRSTGGCGNPYVVQAGDSLSVIAARCGVTLAALAAANGLNPAGMVFVGQSLVIPSSPSGDAACSNAGRPTSAAPTGRSACTNPYVVSAGDTLSLAAVRCRTTVENLRRWNNLRTDSIRPGQRLVTQGPPAGTPAPMPTPTRTPTSTPRVRLPLAQSGPSNQATPTPRIEPTISPW